MHSSCIKILKMASFLASSIVSMATFHLPKMDPGGNIPLAPCTIVCHQVQLAPATASRPEVFLTLRQPQAHSTSTSEAQGTQQTIPIYLQVRSAGELEVSTIFKAHRKASMILLHTSQTVALSSAVKVTAQSSVNYTHQLYSNTKSP